MSLGIQLASYIGLMLGWAGGLIVPRTRHGWLLAIGSGLAWSIVDISLGLWAGLAGATISVVLNGRCWRRKVTGGGNA